MHLTLLCYAATEVRAAHSLLLALTNEFSRLPSLYQTVSRRVLLGNADTVICLSTLMLEQGKNLKVVQEVLGHSSIAQTMNTYSHISPTIQRVAFSRLAQKRGLSKSYCSQEVNAAG